MTKIDLRINYFLETRKRHAMISEKNPNIFSEDFNKEYVQYLEEKCIELENNSIKVKD